MKPSSCNLLRRRRPRALIGQEAARATRSRSSDVERLRTLSSRRDDPFNGLPYPSLHCNHRYFSSTAALDPVYEHTCSTNDPATPALSGEDADGSVPGIVGEALSLQTDADPVTEISAQESDMIRTATVPEPPLSTEKPSPRHKRGKGLQGIITDKTNMASNNAGALLEAADILLKLIKEKQKGKVRGKIKPLLVNRLLSAAIRCKKSEKNRRIVHHFVVKKLDKMRVGLEALAETKDGKASTVHINDAPFDATTYNFMAHLWASSDRNDAPEQVKKIFVCMEDVGLNPDTVTYYHLLRALVKSKALKSENKPIECEALLQEMKDRGVDRTQACFNACLTAWANSGRKDAPQRAEDMLISMQKLKIQPNFVSFTTVIDCLGKSAEANATERAEDLLRLMAELDASGMPDVRPTSVTYNSVINAHSKRAKTIADAKKADNLLQEMKTLSRVGYKGLAPDRISYTSCINAYSKVDDDRAAKRSVELLREMTETYESRADDSMAPDLFAYNAVLRTLGRQIDGYHADMAKSILDEMVRQYTEEGNEQVKPDIMSFNSVIRSCSLHSSRSKLEKQAALVYALETLTDIRNQKCGVTADEFTFAFFFRVVANSVDSIEQAEKLLRRAFKWCCETGNLSAESLESLKVKSSGGRVNSFLFLQKMLRTEKKIAVVKVSDLPSEWSRNTGPKRK
jgi:hypothetical protein